ncbi:MAG: PaaI family thioesterase [Chloroflexi bacterium]|nr:PaaI family thioesterase [Chloroflexota bacterium]
MNFPKDKQLWLDNIQEISNQTIIQVLGIEFIDIDNEHIELQMPITDAVRQPYGMLHGGASMVLAETAASAHASWGVDLTKKVPVAIEINGSHLRSAADGHVRAVGKIMRWSSSLVVHTVEIIHLESGNLLSIARITNYYKKLQSAAND